MLLPLSAAAADIQGRIIGVHDGDTATLLDVQYQQHKMRLAGIDAPELKQAFGRKSKEHLSSHVFNRHVVAECSKIDKYQRKVCVIKVDGMDANLEQVKAGMAWWYRKYAKEQFEQQRVEYEAAESAARSSGLGLWADRNPLPPWEWRRSRSD